MYEQYYGLNERPFSITPDPRFVFLSPRHRDALAHLLFGVGQGGSGGFIQLTGEVGTGKTTLCRLVLEKVPANTRIALILNPMLSPLDLLRAIGAELELDLDGVGDSLLELHNALNRFLLERHAEGERVVLIIDEAQNMSRDALEQIRMLTNLETATDKLLQIILLGQPELRDLLAQPELRQLAQRITARYHLDPLSASETEHYVRHRLAVAGASRCPFERGALKELYRASEGVPRLINIIADRALMAGYAHELERIDADIVDRAAAEVAGEEERPGGRLRGGLAIAAVAFVLFAAGGVCWLILGSEFSSTRTIRPAWVDPLEHADRDDALVEIASVWPDLSHAEIHRACAEDGATKVACLPQRGNWALIERIGLPVILQLVDPPGAFVTLVGIDAGQLLIRHHGQHYRVPKLALERRWMGEFLVIWPDHGRVLSKGETGTEVGEMKALAARLKTLPWTGPVDDRYDEAFAQWVAKFQAQNGLRQDGMIGPATRLFLRVPAQLGPSLTMEIDGD